MDVVHAVVVAHPVVEHAHQDVVDAVQVVGVQVHVQIHVLVLAIHPVQVVHHVLVLVQHLLQAVQQIMVHQVVTL